MYFKKIIKKIISKLGYRLVHSNGKLVLEKNIFFDEFMIYQGRISSKVVTVFDVGSHVGDTVDIYKKYFKNSIIHCFEPALDSFSTLQSRFLNNQNIILNNIALGEKSGSHDLYLLGEKSTGNSLLKPTDASFAYKNNAVTVKTIDDYCKQNDIQYVDLLKIDVQGFEKEVLLGSLKFLEEKRIDFIKLEYILHEFYDRKITLSSIDEILTNNGYGLIDICSIKKSSKRRQTLTIDMIYQSSKKA